MYRTIVLALFPRYILIQAAKGKAGYSPIDEPDLKSTANAGSKEKSQLETYIV